MNRSADGFNVNTDALSATSVKYRAVSASLSASCQKLQELQLVLQNQTLPAAIAESFGLAIATVRAAAQETDRYGQQCKEIAQVYDRTEKEVLALVDTLLTGTAFTLPASGANAGMRKAASLGGAKGLDNIFNKPALAARVDSPLISVAPVMFAGNRLPCESWLLNRAMKAANG